MTARVPDPAWLTRRSFVGALAAGPVLWATALRDGRMQRAVVVDRLGPPDASGMRLPPGFTSRVLARSGQAVGRRAWRGTWLPTALRYFRDHRRRAGGPMCRTPKSTEPVAACRRWTSIAAASSSAYDSILTGTNRNCAGGPTPWGTWLSCEEVPLGRVFECDPVSGGAIARPNLGRFRHEAAVVDPLTGHVYLTEDLPDGRLYRFVPTRRGQVASGTLFAASVAMTPAEMTTDTVAAVTWRPTSVRGPDRAVTTSSFDGGEGAWVDGRRLLFTTKGDARVWELDLDAQQLTVLHDCVASPDTPLDAVDNIVVHPTTGDVYVAEDAGNMQLCVLREDADGSVSVDVALQIEGQDGSEITGPAFSPGGSRLYVSSQRGTDGRGITYEISGPFARNRWRSAVSTCGLETARRLR